METIKIIITGLLLLLLSTINYSQIEYTTSIGLSNEGRASGFIQIVDKTRLIDIGIGLNVDGDNITPVTSVGYLGDKIGLLMSAGISFKYRDVKVQDNIVYMKNKNNIRILVLPQIIVGRVTLIFYKDLFSPEQGLMFGYRFKLK